MALSVESVMQSRSTLGEGAVRDDRAGCLWWVDIPPGLIHRYDPASGANETWEWGEALGCVAVREKGGLLLATRSGFHFFDPETGERQALADPEADQPENRFNDGTTDMQGRFWAGTMKHPGDPARTGRFTALTRIRGSRLSMVKCSPPTAWLSRRMVGACISRIHTRKCA